MKILVVTIAIVVSLNLIEITGAYVLPSSTENANEIGGSFSSAAVENPKRQHIAKIVPPSEIRLPTLALITTLIDSLESEKTDKVNTLTYTDLYKLLAQWHLSNEKNFYQMQPATTTDPEANEERAEKEEGENIEVPESGITAAN